MLKEWCPAVCDAVQYDMKRQTFNRTIEASAYDKMFGGGGVRFRRIYGPKYEDGKWKSRTNRELEEVSTGENIVKRIKGQRISWLGHLERMEENRMPKKIFTQ
jgi:hypothetical protein